MTHLTEEPDVEPIHKQVMRLVRDGHLTNRGQPVGVVFNTDGYREALSQTVPGMDPWNGGYANPATHYLGLPFTKDPKQAEPVRVTFEGDPK